MIVVVYRINFNEIWQAILELSYRIENVEEQTNYFKAMSLSDINYGSSQYQSTTVYYILMGFVSPMISW